MMLLNIFDIRNSAKQRLHSLKVEKEIYIRPREIWYVSLGINIGYEQNGKGSDFKRPVLVLKKLGNVFLTVAMTTKGKDNNFFYSRLPNSYFDKPSYIIISQAGVVDKNRFIEKLITITEEDFANIKKELRHKWL